MGDQQLADYWTKGQFQEKLGCNAHPLVFSCVPFSWSRHKYDTLLWLEKTKEEGIHIQAGHRYGYMTNSRGQLGMVSQWSGDENQVPPCRHRCHQRHNQRLEPNGPQLAGDLTVFWQPHWQFQQPPEGSWLECVTTWQLLGLRLGVLQMLVIKLDL